MRKYGVVLTAAWFALASGVRAAQSPGSESTGQETRALTTTQEVVDIEEVNLLRRAALVLQMVFTPSRRAEEVAPLYACSKETVCGDDATVREDDGDTYGPAAVVLAQETGQERMFHAICYRSTTIALGEIWKDPEARQEWCDSGNSTNEYEEYFATRFLSRSRHRVSTS